MQRRDFLAAVAAVSMTGVTPVAAYTMRERPIGLILVGNSWCEFCKAAVATLNAASAPAEMPLLIASQDGLPIAPLEEFVDARGHPLASTVDQVPSLLFVHIPTHQVIAKLDGFRNPRAYINNIRSVLLQAQEAGYA